MERNIKLNLKRNPRGRCNNDMYYPFLAQLLSSSQSKSIRSSHMCNSSHRFESSGHSRQVNIVLRPILEIKFLKFCCFSYFLLCAELICELFARVPSGTFSDPFFSSWTTSARRGFISPCGKVWRVPDWSHGVISEELMRKTTYYNCISHAHREVRCAH